MRAVQYHQYGGPQVLVVEDADEPHAGPGQVRIHVRAASVNPVDWKFRAGHLAQFTPSEFPVIPGRDAAGVVDEVGSGASHVEVGDEVFGLTVGGATAEFAVLSAWATKPEAWSFAQAAAAGVAVATAAGTLDALGVTAGTVVLIEGAAGGVGTAAVQLAVARGATVIGTASQGHHELLLTLGAKPTTYGQGLPDRVRDLAPQGVDAVLDTAGSGSLPDLIAIAGNPQKVLTIADYSAAAQGVKVSRGRGGNAVEGLVEAARLGNEGRFCMPVHAEFPMDQVGAAHELSATGHVSGKVVITIT